MSDLNAWLQRAEQGETLAQLVLANAYLVGRHVPQSDADSARWLDAACASNHPEALLYHAGLAALGLGRVQDIPRAYALVVRAAAAGSERAQGQLAVLGGPALEHWRTPIEAVRHFQSPRIFTLPNFIPKAVCDWHIAQTRDFQEPALVLDKNEGPIVKHTRTNSSATLDKLHSDLVVQLVNVRIAQAVGLPETHQEPTNVLFYQPGQEYKPHHDFLRGERLNMRAHEIEEIGQRVATLLIYLSDDYEGGETAFPRLGWRYKGHAGDALLFWNAAPDGLPDHNTLHAGLPVRSGEKWLLSKWIRAKPIPLNSDYLWGDA